MKNVFIVLLVAAVGAGVYFYFSKKQKTSSSSSKELILGKWKMDSLAENEAGDSLSKFQVGLIHSIDSSLKNYEFEFRKDSLILQTLNGKIQDTSHYEIAGTRNLLIWSNNDTAKVRWNIDKLDSTILIVKDQDSASFYFQRVKE
jgi:hypothetical protein